MASVVDEMCIGDARCSDKLQLTLSCRQGSRSCCVQGNPKLARSAEWVGGPLDTRDGSDDWPLTGSFWRLPLKLTGGPRVTSLRGCLIKYGLPTTNLVHIIFANADFLALVLGSSWTVRTSLKQSKVQVFSSHRYSSLLTAGLVLRTCRSYPGFLLPRRHLWRGTLTTSYLEDKERITATHILISRH